jgi:amidase
MIVIVFTRLMHVEYPGQQDLVAALNDSLPTDEYEKIKTHIKLVAKTNGIDKTLKDFDLDVVIGPMDGRIPTVAAAAGYPVGAMPLGYSKTNGRPFGLAIVAAAGNEGLILQAMSAWEQMRPKRQPPPQMVELACNEQAKM